MRASSSSFYSHLQAEIAHTSKDAVTIVTREKPRRNAAALWPLSRAVTLNSGLMDTDYSEGDQALNDPYLYEMARGLTQK